MASAADAVPGSDAGAAIVTEPASWESTICSLCGDARSRSVFSASDLLYGCPGEFTLVRCEACRHVFLNPRPTRECIGQFYPADYGPFRGGTTSGRQPEADHRQPTISGRQPEADSRQPLSPFSSTHSAPCRSKLDPRSWRWLRSLVLWWIDSRAAPIPKWEMANGKWQMADRQSPISNLTSDISNLPSEIPPRALELGCSHGAFLQQLRDRGWECLGIEPAGEVARRAAECGLEVRVGSLESVVASDPQTFAPSSFDAVVAWMVVEHLHDPIATLRLARELLKPGGTLSFSVPNFGCWERRAFGQFWYALQLPTHLQHFTTTSLRRLLETSGFELVELIHQRNVNNLVGSAGLWLRTKFPRWSLGERLILWTDDPSALGLCLLALPARIFAAVHQSGRLTVVARATSR
ncbi:MAG: class I SAM-dependent methyltransferase [Planctomycetaceae bacterium]